jgi:hypothetical protein
MVEIATFVLMSEKPDKPYYNKRIFWDVDADKMDVYAKANFIIERVFDRGDVEDIRYCRRFYGDEKVKEALLEVKSLRYKRIHLASAIINEPLEAFRCYKLRQLNPERFPY